MIPSKLCMIGVFVVCLSMVYCCQPPDCENQDCGTCGNACCGLQFFIQSSTQDVYNVMAASLKKGGADGRYTYKGGQDLRPFNTTADFILQGWHSTLKNHYNDTLDFNIVPYGTGYSAVTAFSISQLAGAYCDAGQNYKNLVGYAKGLGVSFELVIKHGCPIPQ